LAKLFVADAAEGCRAQGCVAANAFDFARGEWIFLPAAGWLRFG
jgi:hypothetical protein